MLSISCCSSRVQVAAFNLQPLVLCSTNSSNQIPKFPNQSYANFLVHNLGFSHQQALSVSTKLGFKLTDAHFSRFSGNANSVIDFFKQHDFDDSNIRKVVSYYPSFLSANVEQTLKRKFKVLRDHGFSESTLVSVIVANPAILLGRLDPPIIRDLRAILGTTDYFIKFFHRNSNLVIRPAGLGYFKSNIALLNKEYGVDINVIRTGIVQEPGCYFKKTDVFQNIVARVEKELGIPPNSRMFTYGIQLLSTCSKESIESKCEVFKSFGWTEYHVSELLRRNPLVFRISEENIRKKLGFLMTELGYKPNFLATKANLFTLSLEKRLVPRHRVLLVLKEKGLSKNYNFYTAFKKTEKEFLKRLIEPFKEDAPCLLELYQSSKGYSNIGEHDQCQALS